MDEQAQRHPRDDELMEDNIIGIYLSTDLWCDSNPAREDNKPKLRRFVHDQESIQQPRLIGKGLHGVVILASIGGVEYALKIFKKWKQIGPVFFPYKRAIYITPLACECRAFARLDSRHENGTWAARCYGWMKLNDAQFKEVGDVLKTRKLSRWTVVKEYRPELTDATHIQTIFTNFTIPKEARIVPEDIRADNYRGSKIVDLSSALTAPCPEWPSPFMWEWFYTKTVHCVFQWFEDE